MHFNIQLVIHHYGYVGITFILLMEMVGIPFPAETTLTISGIEWSHGVFKLIPLIIAAGLGNILGSTIAYGIGRFLGRPVIVRLGKYVGITDDRLEKANNRFDKYRTFVILFGKFIAGIRVLIPYLAGINKMSFWAFSLLNAASAIVWVTLFMLLGRYLGIELSHYYTVFHHLTIPIIMIVVLFISFVIIKHFIKKRTHKHQKTEKQR